MDELTDFIDISDVSNAQIDRIYELADEMREDSQRFYSELEDKTLLMLFAKPSTRTRISFETGMTQLGGHAINFTQQHSQLSRGESLKDTAKVVSRYADAIMARLYEHEQLLALQQYADVPVINGLTDALHPCQALADLYTLEQRFDDMSDVELVFVGDGNNVAHSVMQACAKRGVDITFSCPQGYEPDTDRIKASRAIGEETGSTIKVVHDPHQAVRGADVLYTDVWVSMGDEDEQRERLNRFRHYQVDRKLVDTAGEPLIMHPLPAHRGMEITSDVLDAENAIVYDQAENRLHVQKAILNLLLDEDS